MKRNKVLLGLYVGLLTLAGGVANAQTGTFYEIGPDNVGGEVSCIVLDRQDTSRNTLYAGAATGGLFLRSQSSDILRNLYTHLNVDANIDALVNNFDIWHHVPFYKDSLEISLPISCMVQGPNNELYIGTGSDDYAYGTTYGPMSRKGMGLYRYIPSQNKFELIPTTSTTGSDTSFNVINCIEVFKDGNDFFLYVGTNSGLYRWFVPEGSENWTASPTAVFAGRVDNIVISKPNHTAFFSSGNQLYRIGDVAASTPRAINISENNTAFGGSNVALKLAVSQTDTTFLYVMVINQNGLMDAIYMTNNEQTWYTLTTSTVMPLTNNDGRYCGALAVDPSDPRRVIVGGSDVLVGQGYTDGSYYQWTTASANEFTLNYGDYMSTVFNSTSFVHSGIHQILPVYHLDSERSYHTVYFATDGGIFASKFYGRDGFDSIQNINRGLNTLQVNGLAVCPDGSLLIGANKNGCPIVEAHLGHFGGDAIFSWYDNGTMGNLNHSANILWNGNGGAVAASKFQQVWPNSRRVIFTTSDQLALGRSYADYLDYTNTSTWTIGEALLTNQIVQSPTIGSISLWESDKYNGSPRYVKMAVDTLGYILRPHNGAYDTVWVNDTANGVNRGSKFQIKRNDKAIFYSRGNVDYPFEYKFTSNQLAKDSVVVANPVQSRMLMVAERLPKTAQENTIYNRAVWFSWDISDFTKVWDANEDVMTGDRADFSKLHYWAPIYIVERTENNGTTNIYPRKAIFSKDGRFAFITVYDTENKRTMIVRVSGFENIDYSYDNKRLTTRLMYQYADPVLFYDTLEFSGSAWLNRSVSDMYFDDHSGSRLILTFEDYSNTYGNVAILNNATGSGYYLTDASLPDATLPVYTAIVEEQSGDIYAGTADGVYVKSQGGDGPWMPYKNLSGVPVTKIIQQTDTLPIRRNLTHTGITANNYVFAKTKWPGALYFGTYGRGVFMDMKYVSDTTNEIVDTNEYQPVGIPTVHSSGVNSVNLYPNPVYNETHVAINAQIAGTAVLRVYDLNGRVVVDRNLGYVAEGEHSYTLDCTGMSKGMYLVNVIIGGHTSAVKMVVR